MPQTSFYLVIMKVYVMHKIIVIHAQWKLIVVASIKKGVNSFPKIFRQLKIHSHQRQIKLTV